MTDATVLGGILAKTNIALVDADDTIWFDGVYFKGLRRAAEECLTASGREFSSIEPALDQMVREAMPGEQGFAEAISSVIKPHLSDGPRLLFDEAICRFLNRKIEFLEGAREALQLMSSRRLVLYTKGNESEQNLKIDRAGVRHLFAEVIIVSKKNTETLRKITKARDLDTTLMVAIGNSVRHDVLPALELGSSAIWLNHSHNEFGRNMLLPRTENAVEANSWDEISAELRVSSTGATK